jgi:hypothetical protein
MGNARRGFDPTAEDSIANAVPKAPIRKHACFAAGCPMPGTIFRDGSGTSGICAWHYGALPSDLPVITQVLKDWQCVSSEVQAARRALTGEFACDPKALKGLFGQAAERVRRATAGGGWGDTFEPREREDYGTWCRRLEGFLTVRVAETVSSRHGQRELQA